MARSNGIARFKQWSLTILVAFGAIAAPRAHADVIYTSRNSTLSIVTCDDSFCSTEHTEQVTDTSLDPFSQSLGVQGSTGYASQVSSLTQSGISVELSASQFGFSEIASTTFAASFVLDAPMSFVLSGRGFWALTGGEAKITFSVPPCFYCVVEQQRGHYYSSQYFDGGILQPGAYTLFVDAVANGPPYLGSPPASTTTATLSLVLIRFRTRLGQRITHVRWWDQLPAANPS